MVFISTALAPTASLTAAAGAWGAYTLLLRVVLGRRFTAMKAVSESRPEGDAAIASALASRLQLDLDAPEERQTLKSLLALRQPLTIVESAAQRLAWREVFRVMAPGSSSVSIAPASCGPRYRFAFRDYVNSEELSQMMTRRGGLTGALLRSTADSLLSIGEGGECTLVDTFRLLAFVPVRIQWEGELSAEADRIDWTYTHAMLGWRRLGRSVERPAAAERLRQNPWLVKMHSDVSGVLVLENSGVGRLVFTEEK